jgi:hypothetical protein
MPVLGALLLLAAAQAPAAPASRRSPAQPAPAVARPPAPAPAATPLRPPAPPGLSWDDADEVARTVTRIERRLRTGRSAADETLVVTERQLNSYVNLTLASLLPAGVSGLQLRLQKDRLGAQAQVDLDRVKGQLPPGATGGLLALLSGTVPVELQGRLVAANGTARVEIEQAIVGGVSLPASLIAQMVTLSTRNGQRPRGFDILAPFPLPWTARDVRLEPGRALVSFFAK